MRHQNWMLFGAGVVLLACAVFTVGCGSSGHGNVRLVNGTLDNTAGLDLLVDSVNKASGVAYGTASPYVSVNTGSRTLQANTSGTSTMIATATANVASKAFYTFMTLNNSGSGTAPVVFTDDNSTPSAGNFKLRIINGSPGLSAQDVYVVPPGTFTAGSPTFPNLAFGSATAYSTLAAGAPGWEVDFTNPGGTTVNLSTTLTESALAVRTLVLLNSQTTGFEAPVLSDLN
jgi:hypothetical protein